MSLWSRISEALAALANGEGLTGLFERLRTPPERSVAFTIAIIALAAKMAKADGLVTRDEVTVFRQLFVLPEGEEDNAARVFDLARQDVAGFDAYARKIAAMFRDDRETRIDILEGLFRIALADGDYHEAEDRFLFQVAEIFDLGDSCFRGLRQRYVPDQPHDPYDILDVPADAALEDIRQVWKALVRENHPDRLQARGVPPEALRIAQDRLVAVNAAWDEISKLRSA